MPISINRILFILGLAISALPAHHAQAQPGPFPTINRFCSDDSLLATIIAKYEYVFIYADVYTEARNTPSSFHYSKVVYQYHILGYNKKKARLMLVTSEYQKKKQKNRIRKSGHRVDKELAKSFFTALDTSGFLNLSLANLNDKRGPVQPDGTARYYSLSDVGSTDALAKTPKGVVFYQCDYPESLILEIPEKSEQRVVFVNILNRFLNEFLGRTVPYYRLGGKE